MKKATWPSDALCVKSLPLAQLPVVMLSAGMTSIASWKYLWGVECLLECEEHLRDVPWDGLCEGLQDGFLE